MTVQLMVAGRAALAAVGKSEATNCKGATVRKRAPSQERIGGRMGEEAFWM